MEANALPGHIGPYEIIEILGQGGMGVVYLADHKKTRKRVALKTIHVPNPQQVTSIRREIRALARIRHPGVVTIVDEGLEEDIPWYAMELLSGVTLRKFCSDFLWGDASISTIWSSGEDLGLIFRDDDRDPTSSDWWTRILGPLIDADTVDDVMDSPESPLLDQDTDCPPVPAAGGSLPTVLKIISRLCRTLAFLHGEGLVHGDLKPDNIMIRSDGMPVLMDFGMVTRIWGEESREELETESIVGGTIVYVSPEQIRGEFVDARADLYSLGCILYELITGRVPFFGKAVSEVLRAKLEMEPVRPSVLAEDVPRELDQMVMRLLTKHPMNRISHAEDVLAIIVSFFDDDTSLEKLPAPRPYLYRSRFAGRDNEMLILENFLDGLEKGEGNFVLIGGESGIGKTRFLMELSRTSRLRKISVLLGECTHFGRSTGAVAGETNIPLQALRQPIKIIGEICRKGGRTETDRILGSHGKLLALYEPRLADLPGQDVYPALSEISSSAARLRLFTSLSDVFSELTINRPAVLILDDLQWADDLTMGFLGFLLRIGRLNKTPLLIIGTHRTDEMNPALVRILDSPNTACLKLEKLDEKAIGDIVTDMLAITEPPAVFVRFLTRFSSGNPFFVAEYLRTAISENVLFRNNRGVWQVAEDSDESASEKDYEALPLPKALIDLVERRLGMISVNAREIISTAAVIGREIPLMLLWHIVPFSDEMLDSLDELIRCQILSEIQPGELRFIHDKFREVVYQGLTREKCVNLHHNAALAIESFYGYDDPAHYSSLSRHWELAGHKTKAQKYYLAGARQAVSQYALLDAELAYRAYMNLVENPSKESMAVRYEFLRKVLFTQGRFKESIVDYTNLLECTRDLDDKSLESRCLLGLAQTNEVMGNTETALEFCRQSLEISQKTGHLENEAAALNRLGVINFNRGHLDDAKTLYQKALDIYQKSGNQPLIGASLEYLALLYWNQGDLKKSQTVFEQALSIFRKIGDKSSLGKCLGNSANIYTYKGEFTRALEQYEHSLAIFREIGDKPNEAVFLSNLGTVHSSLGDTDSAQHIYEKALKIQREIPDRRMEGITLNNLGIIFLEKGFPEKAEEFYHAALSIHRELNNRQQMATTLFNLGHLKCVVDGDFDAADTIVKEAISLYQTIGNQLSFAFCCGQLGHIALARGISSQEYLNQIQSAIKTLKVSPDSELVKDYNRLKHAEDTFQSGGNLFRGVCIEYISDGLRNWLIKNGHLPDS